MFKRHHQYSLAALALGLTAALAPVGAVAQESAAGIPAGEYSLDKAHSTLIVRADHLGFSFYTAAFSELDAKLTINPADPTSASLTATVDVGSLQLPAPPDGFRDLLLGPQWFDAGAFPKVSYQSTGIERTGASTARVTGDLTWRGRTRPVVLDVTFNGGYPGMEIYDPQARIGFSARGILSRSDFGASMGLPPEGSNMGVGDDVEIIIEAEFSGPPLDTHAQRH